MRTGLLLVLLAVACAPTQRAASRNLALHKQASASSVRAASREPERAIDGTQLSRWVSRIGDNEWLAVDLGRGYDIDKIRVVWMWGAGTPLDYRIQTSLDAASWDEVFRGSNPTTKCCKERKITEVGFRPRQARFVRVQGDKPVVREGDKRFPYSIYEPRGRRRPHKLGSGALGQHGRRRLPARAQPDRHDGSRRQGGDATAGYPPHAAPTKETLELPFHAPQRLAGPLHEPMPA